MLSCIVNYSVHQIPCNSPPPILEGTVFLLQVGQAPHHLEWNAAFGTYLPEQLFFLRERRIGCVIWHRPLLINVLPNSLNGVNRLRAAKLWNLSRPYLRDCTEFRVFDECLARSLLCQKKASKEIPTGWQGERPLAVFLGREAITSNVLTSGTVFPHLAEVVTELEEGHKSIFSSFNKGSFNAMAY